MGTLWKILKSFGWRFVIAAIFFTYGWRLLVKAIGCNNQFEAITLGLSFLACFCVGAILIAFRIDQYFGDFLGRLFYPDEKFDHPQPMYSVPEGKRKSGLYQEAFKGFQKIADQFPQELKSYVEMIDIAIVDMNDKKKADLVFHKAIATLDDREDCDTLLKMYKAFSSRPGYFPRDSDPIPLKHHDHKSLDTNPTLPTRRANRLFSRG